MRLQKPSMKAKKAFLAAPYILNGCPASQDSLYYVANLPVSALFQEFALRFMEHTIPVLVRS